MTRRAGIYLRISQDRLGEELGIARQREDCTALAERKGWEIVDEYPDNDVSAFSTKPRPEYIRMLQDLRLERIDAVVVWDEDRLTRRPIEIEEFIELADDFGIALASVAGDVDIGTDSGRLHLRIKAAVARDEVEKKARRQRRQRRQTAEAGRQSGGPRAFGYTPDGMHLDPDEAALVAEMYQQFLSGATLNTIARKLNDREVFTPKGNPWTYRSVRTVLSNPRNAGIRGVRHLLPGRRGRDGARQTWHTEIGPAVWPAIVPREQWDAVMATLKDPRRGERHTGNRQRYLLSGIAECGVCGELIISGRRAGARLLRCSTLRHVSRRAEPIESFVVEIVLGRLADPDVLAALTRAPESTEDVTALRARARVLIAKKQSLTRQWIASDDDDAETLRFALSEIDAELNQVDEAMARTIRTDRTAELLNTDDPMTVWRSWPLEIQRALLAKRFRIIVQSGKSGQPGGRRFDPSTVQVLWRRPQDFPQVDDES